MTNKEYEVDRKETILGCAVILGCGILSLTLGACAGIFIYKHWFLLR